MNYTQVEQFLTIVKYMNLSKAANELYISQPALSLAMSRLEKEIGISLFYRTGNKLVLSPNGKELYDSFKEIQQANLRFKSKVESLKHTPEEFLKLGFYGNVMEFATMSADRVFSHYTDKELKMVYAAPELLTSLLLNGQIDFALSCPPLEGEKLSSVVLTRERKEKAATALSWLTEGKSSFSEKRLIQGLLHSYHMEMKA